ncbi:uncharacterized protein LOC123542956 [Mercenaria mercenaria]|uniref:uncharacterized protein LOC123542956 n=1 Tax=Mercenaria mercenaria TaxID=6596 RepID=UPI00234E5FCD|nr:uncharacterized protein LOC123542956 [Mercenaria mercenaria]
MVLCSLMVSCGLVQQGVRSLLSALGAWPVPSEGSHGLDTETEVMRAPLPSGEEVTAESVQEELLPVATPVTCQPQPTACPRVDVTAVPEDAPVVDAAGIGEGVPQVVRPEEHEVGPVPQEGPVPFPFVPEVEVVLPPLPVILGNTGDGESLGGVVGDLEVSPVECPDPEPVVGAEVFVPRRSTRTRRPPSFLQITWVGKSYD